MVAVACGSGHLLELFITKLKLQFKQGFTKVVVTSAGHLLTSAGLFTELTHDSLIERGH